VCQVHLILEKLNLLAQYVDLESIRISLSKHFVVCVTLDSLVLEALLLALFVQLGRLLQVVVFLIAHHAQINQLQIQSALSASVKLDTFRTTLLRQILVTFA
jgi:hypothetical protein